ncbi:MAG: ABC transporter permease [Clostridiaceae bacterium]|nr:ABC transporter permease [Clostridiaceae bacterium]
MVKFIIKRLFTIIPVLFGVTFLVYLLMTIAPGNPELTPLRGVEDEEERQQISERLGLNDPIIVRYARMMKRLFFDKSGKASAIMIKMRVFLPNSLKLCFSALAVSVVLALPLGIIAAIRQNTLFDGLSMAISLIGVSMPNFWLGLLMMIVFSLKLGWFPTSGSTTPAHIVLPAATLAFINMAAIARVTRSSMLEVIRQDYIRTAKAKGVPYRRIIRKHALKNALIPTITIMGVQLGELLSGTIIIENIYAWPGVGRLLMKAIDSRDMSTMIACVIVFAIFVSIVNLCVDILYSIIDPRISMC